MGIARFDKVKVGRIAKLLTALTGNEALACWQSCLVAWSFRALMTRQLEVTRQKVRFAFV